MDTIDKYVWISNNLKVDNKGRKKLYYYYAYGSSFLLRFSNEIYFTFLTFKIEDHFKTTSLAL